ncbi:hypothetical protein [Peptostreptococcus faecalis]|uniref:hypothetical protein n=1 Tax=Peptostreptococcus faecalis TaxID=2045015 RepID=UPI000C7B2A6E|nr:hypothetical protein [Peptostreptococcus faecalis]
MVFGSIEECEAYIKSCMTQTTPVMAQKTQEEGKNIISGQVGGITGSLANSVFILGTSANSMEVGIEDRGGGNDYSWTSQVYRTHFFPMYGLEKGHTWNRGATTIIGFSSEKTHDFNRVDESLSNTL